jgi:predicted nucleic acid-binding protein
MKYSVLLDTSFFIRLLNDQDPLHQNAVGYYKYFLEKEITLKVSTISIAEYCVMGKLEDLPLKNLQVLPLNLKDAERTGGFANVIFRQNKIEIEKLTPRPIIPNDSKLFAQADLDKSIQYFVTSDSRSKKTLNLLKKEIQPKFSIISIDTPHNEEFGVLDL